MVRDISFTASRIVCPLTFAAVSLVATSAAFGWGRDISTTKDDYRFLHLTQAQDLMGRWRDVSASNEAEPGEAQTKDGTAIDIVPCGEDYCGIAVGADGACGAVILTFVDKGPRFAATGANEYLERFAGVLDWHDKTGTYHVVLDVGQESGTDKPLRNDGTKLEIDGSSDGTYARAYPFQVTASYSGAAACRAPIS